jgi:uncharacterized NAD(P)/FAD-binding protein YdhS
MSKEAAMAEQSRRKIAVVGSGASAVLLASALAKPGPVLFDVTLTGPRPGRGLAFGVSDEGLLLNTRAGDMSLDACSPSGFVDWLNTYRSRPEGWSGADFAPRRFYGDYLEARLASLCGRTPGLGSTTWRQGQVKALALEESGWSLILASGERLQADEVVLAAGPGRPRPLVFNGRAELDAYVQDDPWDEAALKGLRRGGEVLIAGQGLSFADAATAIWRIDPEIRVVAVSRHGLAPRIHRPDGSGATLFASGYPSSARELQTRLLNASGLIEDDHAIAESRLEDLRRHGARMWAALGPEERHMFQRHFRPYWDAERHRLPPVLGEALKAAAGRGKLELVRGRIAEGKPLKSGDSARAALMTHAGPRALTVRRIINCTGPETDPYRSRNPALLDLLAQGLISADELGLGLRVTEADAAIGSGGRVTPGLHALGALTQGRHFEITGAPEIRAQAQALAASLAAPAGRQAPPRALSAANAR